MNQDLDLFNALIDNGAIVNYHNTFGGETQLIEACSYKQYDSNFAKKLVENGADINDTTCSTNIHISPLIFKHYLVVFKDSLSATTAGFLKVM